MESNTSTPRHHKIFWGSSYDRGLDMLLFMWPDVIEKFPDAELHICYGWDLFDVATRTNPERQQWKQKVVAMMEQKGIYHHGRVGKEKLGKVRSLCGIWAYPTYFDEINCITALECQRDGLVPVVIKKAALAETVKSGILVEGDITKDEVRKEYTDKLISLMGDKSLWDKFSKEGKKAVASYSWDEIAPKWEKLFSEELSTPFVSVVTITIREGFWNLMAENLSRQTYKNFEWIIVDDYKKSDRREIAEKYAKKYNLNIRYIAGDMRSKYYKRQHGLVRANNTAWKNANGELLVFLQDFIIIPERGIERLVDLYRHNSNCLIAPVDDYFHCKTPDLSNAEDWWNGNTDIIGAHSWRNIRVKWEGIRKTENPFDFEMNYGAIPKKILDHLNGWWEFFDDGIGYDNTEIAYRALELGYDVIIDDSNKATCLDLWPHIGGTAQNIEERERHLNTPRWKWFLEANLPLVRDNKKDDEISLQFTVPKDVEDKYCATWINKHADEIAKGWRL